MNDLASGAVVESLISGRGPNTEYTLDPAAALARDFLRAATGCPASAARLRYNMSWMSGDLIMGATAQLSRCANLLFNNDEMESFPRIFLASANDPAAARRLACYTRGLSSEQIGHGMRAVVQEYVVALRQL